MGKKSKKKRSPTKKGGSEATASSQPETITRATAEFNKGDRVSLRGLQKARYNGKVGSIVSVPKSSGGRYGVMVDGMEEPVAIRSQNITLESRRKSTQQQREERNTAKSLIERPPENTASAHQMSMMRMMMDMFMTEEHQIKIFGRKIEPMPDFQAEMMSQGETLPFGVDRTWANEYLQLAFEQACSLPHMMEMDIKREDYEPDPCDIMKRLCTNDPEVLQWYFGGHELGDIYQKRAAHPYSDVVSHSFSNQQYRKEVLYSGTTHVAVGFVDLGILFASELRDPPENRYGPLHFVGVEASAYAIAKTHVIWEMMKQTPATSPLHHLRNIMQAWFSATWGQGTQDAVKAALATVLSSEESFHPYVQEILTHWADAPPFPLSMAREEIAKATTNSFSSIGNLKRRQDRIALARYELGRDFGVHGKPTCGNILMFDYPDGTPPLDNDESVFSAFNWKEIVKLMKNSTLISVMEAAEMYALANIAKLTSWATSQEVVVELKCSRVQDVIEDITSCEPWTMSWSNLCDYCDYAEFHRMARKCSVHGDTIHFGYSMNWVLIVFGVNVIDFCGEEGWKLRAGILESSNQSAQRFYGLLGWDQFLRLPPPTNPINTASHFGLEQLHYRKWSDYFFELARRQGPCEVGNVEHGFTTSPLSLTGTSTVAFTWTYDPEIKFNNLNC